MNNELEDVIEKYFKDRKPRYYHPADAINDDQYIRWEYFNGDRKQILISLGSNDGEVRVRVFANPKSLEDFIKLVIYPI